MSLAAASLVLATPSAEFADVRRARISAKIALVFIFSLLAIDGFPAGIAVLREFGARPINFCLAAAAGVFMLESIFRLRFLPIRRATLLVTLAIVLSVSVLNLAIAITRSGPDIATILSTWGRQFLMLAWGVCSFFTWRRILRMVDPSDYSKLMCVAAVLPILAFFLEFAAPGGAFAVVLEPLRTKVDPRPSGFSTEPSTFTSWATVIWPLAIFVSRSARSFSGRMGAWLLLLLLALSTYLSGARTGVVIFILQVTYFCYWWLRRQKAFGSRLLVSIAAAALSALAILLVWDRLTSLTNLQDDGSNVARFAYTLAGIQLFLSHPLAGTGIGQFSYFFPLYVPDFAMRNLEVANFTFGVSLYRASTFNLFVRLLCEFGLPLGAFLAWLVIRPIVAAARSRLNHPFLVFSALSAVGGAGFWLSQDQYGYQPAILSLAVLSLALKRARRSQDVAYAKIEVKADA